MTQVVPKNFNVSFVKLVEKEEEEVEALEVKKETEKKRKNYKEKIPVVYETETGDPDDMFAIAYIVRYEPFFLKAFFTSDILSVLILG